MSEHGLGPGAFVYVADSAMVTEENLQVIEPNRFVTRLPANYKQCECAVRKAVDSEERAPDSDRAMGRYRYMRQQTTYNNFFDNPKVMG